MRSALAAFWADESAVTAVEYGLIAGLIALLLTLTLSSIGGSVSGLLIQLANCLGSSSTGGC